MSVAKPTYLPITCKKEQVTNRCVAQLKQLVNANALPLTPTGKISLRTSQVTVESGRNGIMISYSYLLHKYIIISVKCISKEHILGPNPIE